MAIAQSMVTSFKKGLLEGQFDFSVGTTDVYKIALYTSMASLGADTTQYVAPLDPNADPTDTFEVSQTGTNYTVGGQTLTISMHPTTSGTTAYINFANVTWADATFTARAALIYKADGVDNPAVAVLDFGANKTASGNDFVIQFPPSDAATAIIRIA